MIMDSLIPYLTVTGSGLLLLWGVVCVLFVLISALFMLEWHRYGVKQSEIVIGETVYLAVALFLLAIAVLSAAFF
jgi:hypothetical protein